MNVTIELRTGNKKAPYPRKCDIQKNIDALARAIDGKPLASDFALLVDTKSVLEAIQRKLPES
jgi:hypothetical protein